MGNATAVTSSSGGLAAALGLSAHALLVSFTLAKLQVQPSTQQPFRRAPQASQVPSGQAGSVQQSAETAVRGGPHGDRSPGAYHQRSFYDFPQARRNLDERRRPRRTTDNSARWACRRTGLLPPCQSRRRHAASVSPCATPPFSISPGDVPSGLCSSRAGPTSSVWRPA